MALLLSKLLKNRVICQRLNRRASSHVNTTKASIMTAHSFFQGPSM